MRIEKLELKGILRFADQVSLDLRDLPAGLIALVGENGSGKTTLLEAVPATLWRSFPSRADRELFDYAQDRDSYLEAVLAVDGRGTYRARLNLDGVRRTSEAVLVAIGADGEQQVLNDGKVTTYDAAIAQTFPPRELVLASAFAAQNRAGSFVTLDRKGRKTLFAKLLGLDHYEAMAQTARTAAGLVDAGRGRLAAVRDLLARDTTPDSDRVIEDQAEVLANARAKVNDERFVLDALICGYEEERTGLKDDVAKHQVSSAQCNALAGQIEWRSRAIVDAEGARDRLNAELVEEWRRIDDSLGRTLKDLRRREADGSGLAREIETIDGRLRLGLQDIDRRLTNNQGLLDQAEAIRVAAEKVEDLDAQSAALRAKDADLARAVGGMQVEWERLLGESHAIDLAKGKLEHAQASTGLLGTVPCGGQEQFSGCQFLLTAIAAKERIPTLETEVAKGQALSHARNQVDGQITALKEQRSRIDGHILLLTQERAKAAVIANKLPALEAAEARIAELTAQRATLVTTTGEQRAAAQQRDKQRREDLQAQMTDAEKSAKDLRGQAKDREVIRRDEIGRQITAQQVELRALKDQLAVAEDDRNDTAGAVARMAVLDQELATARRRWDETTAIVARLEAETADVERRRQALDQRRAELADVDGRLRGLEAELVEWQLLARALGRDGLQVLEIDAAGPTVSAFCNDLLRECYGPRFSVDLVTQQAKVSGKGMREAFELAVIDNERGGAARDIGDLSGGEQVIVSEALANAIALVVNARGQSKILTAFRDETSGALDPENADRYVAMLRRFRELGGFEHVLFVSHQPAVTEQADAQIYVHDGKAEIILPPYQAAA